MPGASFLEWHGERLRERACDRFRVIGIDEQGAPEIDRGASEPGQDKDARIIRILSSDVFLRDEVHPVAQWLHEANARRPIKPRQHRPAVYAVYIADRRP